MKSLANLLGFTVPDLRLDMIATVLLCLPYGQIASAQQPVDDDSASQGGGAEVHDAIEADRTSSPSDAEISARLRAIFENLSSMERITIDVNDGVILLGGETDDMHSRDLAQRLAERVIGGVIVVNNIELDRSLRARLAATANNLSDRFAQLVGMAPLLLLSVFIVAVAVALARWAGRAKIIYGRVSHNWFVRDLVRQVTQALIVVTGAVITLQLLDATAMLRSIVGALGILGLAIGFATRDTVENYIASILLSIRQPFRREDHVHIDSIEGKVLRLTPRATILMSLDGNHVRIPNATVFKATIVNYTMNPLRRFGFEVGVSTAMDLGMVRKLATDTIGKLTSVLESPAPSCRINSLGDSSVILLIHGWIDQRQTDFLKLRSEAHRVIKEAFDNAGIVMPKPSYNVNLCRLSGDPHRTDFENPQPVASESTVATDTAPDRAVDEQIRAETQAGADSDLLNEAAARE